MSEGNIIPRSEKFRLNKKNLALTWPQCDTDKKVVEENIKKFFDGNLKGYIIAQEHHKDGNLHIHAAVHCIQKVDIKNPNALDILTGKHGKRGG